MRNGLKTELYNKMLENRIIFIDREINSETASEVVSQLLYLNAESEEDIKMYINSPGGEVTSGLMIYDTMQFIACDIETVGVGLSASMASILLMGGTKGKRKMLKHAKCMLHDIAGGAEGKLEDVLTQIKNMQRTHDVAFEIMASHTNLSKAELEEKLKTDLWLMPQEALQLGIIDKIVE